jgi:hypothetical protein
LRNFTLGKRISDEKVVSEQGLHTILDLIGVMVPFVSPPLRFHFVAIYDSACPQKAITETRAMTRSWRW